MDHNVFRQWLTQGNDIESTPGFDPACPEKSVTTADVHKIVVGTGDSIYASLQPVIESTEQELILVTCFWARSSSLSRVIDSLYSLSKKGARQGRRIKVRIYFSSSSILQKLFHTSSLNGRTYRREEWKSMHLPTEDLPGLEISIKSIFVRPFSVMHPKFILVDRQVAVLPSCNVSWEDWLEGAVILRGPVVSHFVRFWSDFWAGEHEELEPCDLLPQISDRGLGSLQFNVEVPCVFLPSAHHVNPQFRPFWLKAPASPKTPLNTFLLASLRHAESTIYIQTPNVTAPPVLRELLNALARGVDVHIVTSKGLMLLEQLITAGTTTARCLKSLVRKYKRLQSPGSRLLEEGRVLGQLRVDYFQAREERPPDHTEPVHSHFKLTIIDRNLLVLGSGNMDRASWYTSQELGVAFVSQQMATGLTELMEKIMQSRRQIYYYS